VPGSTGKQSLRNLVSGDLELPLDTVLAKMSPLEDLSIGELNKNLLRLDQYRVQLQRNFPRRDNAIEESAHKDLRAADLIVQRIKLALIRKEKLHSPSKRNQKFDPDRGDGINRKLKHPTAAAPKGAQSNRLSTVDPKSTRREELNFSHSDDYRSIRFNGKEHSLTMNQSRIVKCMHDAFKRKHPDVGKAQLLSAIESETSEIRHSFKKSPLWKTLVVAGRRRGTYRLNLPNK
jgi:hypothetical protein